ncbi:hypothetical protein CRUP_020488 [Coryphaenoides rupestris]|nr:hypothetical protein CRUP_020488 [Coryphaenoides rupestris]
MEIQWRLWNKDWASSLRPWIPILLGLHLQFSRASNCPEECRCDRTFVYCNERSLTSVPFGIGEGYKTLYLHNNQINNAGFPLQLHHVASVETVYLYGNQLDEFPITCPKIGPEELRLDENRIAVIVEEAFRNVTRLERLLLDGNLLTDEGIAPGTFQDLVTLRELSLARNSLTYPPPFLPGEVLVKLNFQENQINNIPAGAFAGLHKLEKLDISSNQLQSLNAGGL